MLKIMKFFYTAYEKKNHLIAKKKKYQKSKIKSGQNKF